MSEYLLNNSTNSISSSFSIFLGLQSEKILPPAYMFFPLFMSKGSSWNSAMLYITSTHACLLLSAILESEDIWRNKSAGLPCSTVYTLLEIARRWRGKYSQVLKSLLFLNESSPPENQQSPAATPKKVFAVCARNILLISALTYKYRSLFDSECGLFYQHAGSSHWKSQSIFSSSIHCTVATIFLRRGRDLF